MIFGSLLFYLLFFVVLILVIWAVTRSFKIMDLNKTYKWMIGVFVIYMIMFVLFFLDFELTNLIDYGDNNIELAIASFIALLFLIGTVFGSKIIYGADEEFRYIKGTKWFIFLFYMFSPFIWFVLSGVSIQNIQITSFRQISILSLFILPLLLFLFIYLFNFTWSKSKRITFVIYYSLINLILGILTWIAASIGMHDGGLS